jgi:hypothetical protein
MKHIDFILWMILFPLSLTIGDYFSAKTRKITRKPENNFSKDTESWAYAILGLIWVFIGYQLF